MKNFWTVEEAAAMVNCSEAKIRAMVHARFIRHHRFDNGSTIMIPDKEVDKLMAMDEIPEVIPSKEKRND